MKLNNQQLAVKINQLAAIRAQRTRLTLREEIVTSLLKKQLRKTRQARSRAWVAKMVLMPAHTVVIPDHDQLRLYKATKG